MKQTVKKFNPDTYKLPKGRVLCLKSLPSNMIARSGFVWPKSGYVKCEDWNPEPFCGNGLHSWLWGQGDGSLGTWGEDSVWLVLERDADGIVDLGGKVKAPDYNVLFTADRKTATDFIAKYTPHGTVIIGGTSTSGYMGTSTSGYMGTSTSGYMGTSTSGYMGTSISGDCGTSTSGDGGTSISGDCGTSTSGDGGTSTSGDCGTSTSGYMGTSTSGDGGTSTSGDCGTSTSGYGGIIQIKYWDGDRTWMITGHVGVDGIEPNVPYVVKDGKLVKKDEQ